jgi:hypothetical protein
MANRPKTTKRRKPKTVLRLPDLEQSKNTVLNWLAATRSRESPSHLSGLLETAQKTLLRVCVSFVSSSPHHCSHGSRRLHGLSGVTSSKVLEFSVDGGLFPSRTLQPSARRVR